MRKVAYSRGTAGRIVNASTNSKERPLLPLSVAEGAYSRGTNVELVNAFYSVRFIPTAPCMENHIFRVEISG